MYRERGFIFKGLGNTAWSGVVCPSRVRACVWHEAGKYATVKVLQRGREDPLVQQRERGLLIPFRVSQTLLLRKMPDKTIPRILRKCPLAMHRDETDHRDQSGDRHAIRLQIHARNLTKPAEEGNRW